MPLPRWCKSQRQPRVPDPGVGVTGRWSLTFEDAGREEAFLACRHEKLAQRVLLGLGLLAMYVLTAIVLAFADQTVYNGMPEARIANKHRTAMFVVIAVVTVAWMIVAGSRLSSRMGAQRFEVGTAVVAALIIVLIACQEPWYLAKISGQSPARLLAFCHSDHEFMLYLDIFLTGCHFLAPFRWKALLPLEVLVVACYAVPALSLGSSHPAAFVAMNIVLMTLLVLAAAVAKRDLEALERSAFVQVAQERTLRAVAEHKLVQLETSGRSGRGTSDASSTVAASYPETTSTGRLFGGLGKSGGDNVREQLEQMVQLGNHEHWLVQPEDLQLQPARVLGSGGFGLVITARYHGSRVAVKLPAAPPREGPCLGELAQELRIFRRLRHPNIVLFYGACFDVDSCHMALILEYVKGVPLLRAVQGPCRNLSALEFRCRLVDGVCCALRYLHSQEPVIIHGDIKSSNILVEQSGTLCRAKLLDFGLSRLLTPRASKLGGTLRWMAPEAIGGQKSALAPSADVFSLGRLVYMIATGSQPLGNISREDIVASIQSGKCHRLQWPKEGLMLKEAKQFCKKCSAFEPSQRPAVLDLQAMLTGWVVTAESVQVAAVLARVFEPDEPQSDLGTAFRTAKATALAGSPHAASGLPRRPSGGREGGGREDGGTDGGGAGGDDEDGAEGAALLYPGMEETPRAARTQALGSCMFAWNISVPAGSCCRLHALLNEVQALANSISDQVCPSAQQPEAWQCPRCKLLILTGNSDAEEAMQCMHCGYPDQDGNSEQNMSEAGHSLCSIPERPDAEAAAEAAAECPGAEDRVPTAMGREAIVRNARIAL